MPRKDSEVVKLRPTNVAKINRDDLNDLSDKITDLIYDYCEKNEAPLALVAGLLEVVKLNIMDEQREVD